MEYKVGQRVKIKSLDWYDKNKDIHGNIECGDALMNIKKSQFCGKIVTISSISDVTDTYKIEEDKGQYIWTDEMIEGLAEEEAKPKYEDEVNGEYYSTPKYLVRPSGYQFVDENGNVINVTKIVLKKEEKKYPKTYEECCKVLGIGGRSLLINTEHITDYEIDLGSLIGRLHRLIICRDAYWKIAGEEMGLGKPWKPDWDNVSDKYCIYFVSGYAWSKECQTRQCPFAFPTPEMRDAFKKNFDPDIDFCKELL